MSFAEQEAACNWCGSVQDPCGCQEMAQDHDRNGDHESDKDWNGCDACYAYSEGPPDHANGMHAGVLIEGCPGCDMVGV